MKMNKIKLLLPLIFLLFSLTGCNKNTTTVTINMKNNNELYGSTLGTDSLIKIGNGLWYDQTTRIVYWWNGALKEDFASSTRWDTTPSPYYAPNGLPYRYNPETNTFEEIEVK